MGSGFLKHFENNYIRPVLRSIRRSRHVRYGISYREEFDGAGTEFGQDFTLTKQSEFYYIGIMRRGELPPQWASSYVERALDSSRNGRVWRRSERVA